MTSSLFKPGHQYQSTDHSPTLWLGLILVSISLHLFGFWLIGKYLTTETNQSANLPTDLIPVLSIDGDQLIGKTPQLSSNNKFVSSQKTPVSSSLVPPKPLSKSLVPNRVKSDSQVSKSVPTKNLPAPVPEVAPKKIPNSSNNQSGTGSLRPENRSKELVPPKKSDLPKVISPSGNQKQLINQGKSLESNSNSGNKTKSTQVEPSKTRSQPVPAQGKSGQGGQGVSLTIQNFRLGNGNHDLPDQSAHPKQTIAKFPTLKYISSTEKSFGQVATLRLLIHSSGQPDPNYIQIIKGPTGVDEQQLIKKMITDWQFVPAYLGGKPVDSLLEMSVILEPL